MGKVILYIAITKDGFIAKKNGSVDFLSEFSHLESGFDEFYQSVGSLLMGGGTFRHIIETEKNWPYEKPTFVVTKTGLVEDIPNNNVSYIDFLKVKSQIKKLQESQKEIWLVGGAKLFQSLHKHKLVDEIYLTIVPINLGEGISLFDESSKINSQLTKIKRYPGGIEENRYKLIYL